MKKLPKEFVSNIPSSSNTRDSKRDDLFSERTWAVSVALAESSLLSPLLAVFMEAELDSVRSYAPLSLGLLAAHLNLSEAPSTHSRGNVAFLSAGL